MARTGTVEEGVAELVGGQVVEAVPVHEAGELVGVRVVVEQEPDHMVELTVTTEWPLYNHIGVAVEHTRKTDSEGRWRTRREL